MLVCRGRGIPALLIISSLVFVLPMAPQALAGSAFRCEFTKECATDQACSEIESISMQFTHMGDTSDQWSLETAEGQNILFTKLRFEAEDLRAFVSTSVDPDASAVSLLSVFSDGQAFLSTHGVFYSPGSVTHLGTCVPKDG